MRSVEWILVLDYDLMDASKCNGHVNFNVITSSSVLLVKSIWRWKYLSSEKKHISPLQLPHITQRRNTNPTNSTPIHSNSFWFRIIHLMYVWVLTYTDRITNNCDWTHNLCNSQSTLDGEIEDWRWETTVTCRWWRGGGLIVLFLKNPNPELIRRRSPD